MSVNEGSSLQLSNSSLNILTEQFSVSESPDSTPLLSVSTEGVSVSSTRMDVSGSLGVAINGPLETRQVQSPANQDLTVQSLSGELRLTGGRGISLQDGAGFGGVAISSNSDLTITSQSGQVREVECSLRYYLTVCIIFTGCIGQRDYHVGGSAKVRGQ